MNILVRWVSADTRGLLLAVFLFGGALFAQTDTGKIEGVVRDKDTSQPLAGAQVMVIGTRLGNVTTSEGYYFILNVPAGLQSVKSSYTGYQTTTQSNVRIMAGHTTTLDFSISATVISLEAITVEAESEPLIVRDNTMTRQRQNAEEIAALPITGIDDVISMQAGVVPSSNGRISIRGGRVGEEAVYVDGVLVKNFTAESTMPPIFSNTSLSQLMPQQRNQQPDNSPLDVGMNAVEEISIITGGFNAEYGHAKSGVVNIVTKEGSIKYSGNVRYRTDGVLPRKMDFGFHELEGGVGGPVPFVPYTFFYGTAEVQGRADYNPRDTRDKYGFHGISQKVVGRINTVIGDTHPRKTSLTEFEQVFDIMGMPHPARRTGGQGDNCMLTEKITSSPVKGWKFIHTFNQSRTQRLEYSYNNEFYWKANTLTRSRVTNAMAGFDWIIRQTDRRSSSLQVRASYFRDNTTNGQPWEHALDSRQSFGGFGWKDIPMWGEIATNDLHDFLLRDPWFNQLDNWPGRLDSLESLTGVDGLIEKYFDSNNDGQYDFTESNIDTESMISDLRRLASDLGIGSYGGSTSGSYRGPWGIQNSRFRSGGPTSDPFLNRYLESRISISKDKKYNLKVDFDNQINRHNRIKLGIDLQYFDNFNYNGGYSWPEATLIDNNPVLFSAYCQDRFDLGDFVIDFGLRMDYMDPKGDEATSLKNYPAEMARKHTRKITEFSPRLGVAFPVTDRTQVRFSFGHFYQPPSWHLLLRGDRLLSGEAVLDFSRTVMFEAGFAALLSNNITVDIVGYNKDVQGDFAYRKFIMPGGELGTTVVTNMDYANIKGADFSLDTRWGKLLRTNLSYSLQFARTTGTDPGSKESALISSKDPITQQLQYLPSFEDPMGLDRTHSLNVQAYLTLPHDFRQGTLAGKILQDVGATLTFSLVSGGPFDLRYTGGRTSGGRQVLPLTNAARGPTYKNFNLRLSKGFDLGARRRIKLFGDITNLFYNRNFRTMYNPQVLKSIDENIVALERRRPDPVAAEISWLPITVDLNDTSNYWWMRQHDLDQDGVITGDEWRIMKVLEHVMDYEPNGAARWIRMGIEYSF